VGVGAGLYMYDVII